MIPAVIAQQSTSPIVQIDTGKLQGVTTDGVTAYKGIPFAAPPVGNLRWRAPQPAAHWQGVRSAANYGHDCMQLPFPSDAAPLGTAPSEDCLVMNVWVPAHPTSAKLPVMVWIYGGGFVNGGSSPSVYDGSNFAKGDVVFVSFNYRLGRFGFFAHPALTAETPNGPLGNYAYMDQIAALQWVKRNIASFGGDPSTVTLFGESAGGMSVHALLTSPLTSGLFQRAIIESGGGRGGVGKATPFLSKSVPNPTGPATPSAESIGLAFAESKGIHGSGPDALAKLRALPADQVVNGLNMASMQQAAPTYSGPMIDGQIVTASADAAYLAGTQLHVPLIIGANSMDIGFPRAKTKEELFAPFGPNAKAAQAAYDPTDNGNVARLGMEVTSDAFMVEPARFVAQTLSADGQPVWEYRFSYVATSLRDKLPGAPHATEIPFVFDTVKARYAAETTPADEQAADSIHQYWLQFVKTGNPNGPGLPHWPQYNATTDQIMDFTNNGPHPEADPWKARLDVTQQLANQHAQQSTPTK
ncbi:MAG: carboxylesterase family protein [Acidobacteria bacterium]|nr:carboxylesterase family protein [Acidobacteriota bacterium]